MSGPRLKVLAAMSGGVDSAVAAALMAEAGHDVTGVTLRLACYGQRAENPRACCTVEAMHDAKRVAMAMGFPHHTLDAEDVFKHRVLMPFAEGYASGRTPYPCALCNQHLKFGDLVARMELTGADVLSTGHYADVRMHDDGSAGLYRGRDADKDQTYALALVPYAALARTRLPLGALTKTEVRAHAQRLGLAVWDKVESQDLCFVPDGDYAGYMTRELGQTRGTEPGDFVDAHGTVLGRHRGVIHYTVGQRKGLGLASSEPWYVLAIDAEANTVTLGRKHELECAGLVTGTVNWLMSAPPADGTRVLARIRYNHAGAMATLRHAEGGAVMAMFDADAPQSAVTPGQLAVFYDGERCLGGAEIVSAMAGTGASGAVRLAHEARS